MVLVILILKILSFKRIIKASTQIENLYTKKFVASN